ncbi:MAG: hypothetical protein HRT47_08095 [Candidatus Caenarcaniphilales bacterium]|nr:hypothetical protein [Candidatus Caenarcaniphilales bacterium]
MLIKEKAILDPSINENTMTLLIKGKGPSSKTFERVDTDTIKLGDSFFSSPKRLEVATINDAWQTTFPCDYNFFGDYSATECILNNYELAKKNIKRLVIPAFPLVYPEYDGVNIPSGTFATHPDYRFDHNHVLDKIKDIPYYIVQSESAPMNLFGIEHFDNVYHVAGSSLMAVCFGIARGFRHFILNGFDVDIDLNEENEIYSKSFEKAYDSSTFKLRLSHYQMCYQKMIEKIIYSGCTYQTI